MDAYTHHLAQVNQTHGVIAADTICNAQGQVLVHKGARIDEATADRLARFKLLRPLEDSIAIENELSSTQLHANLVQFFEKDSSLRPLYQLHNRPEQLSQCCDYFCSFPLLRQKLTVISLQLPAVFEQALFSAWAAMIMGHSIEQVTLDYKALFTAGLSRDLGMVHISPDLLKRETLSVEEQRQVQAHPVIAYNILKATQQLNPLVGRAVLEHHEHLDGTGYPRGLAGNQLCAEGQLLNLLDNAHIIYNKHFKPFQRGLRQLIPIIQINQHSRFGAAADTLIMLLKQLPSGEQHDIPEQEAAAVIDLIRLRHAHIQRCLDIASMAVQSIGFRHQSPPLANIQNAVIHLTMSITQSGIIDDAYLTWLDQVSQRRSKGDYAEIEEAFLMIQEVIYHFEKLRRQMQLYLESAPLDPEAYALKDHFLQLEKESLPKIDPALANLWVFKPKTLDDANVSC